MAFLPQTAVTLEMDFEMIETLDGAAAEEPSPEKWPKYILTEKRGVLYLRGLDFARALQYSL